MMAGQAFQLRLSAGHLAFCLAYSIFSAKETCSAWNNI